MTTQSVRYKDGGPVNCTNELDLASIAGKTAIVTGGASGIGAAYVRALSEAGATVVIGDVDRTAGEKLADELSGVFFSFCNVNKWDDQIDLFRKTKSVSPAGTVDIVIANAGIAGPDPVFLNDEDVTKVEEPQEPRLNILTVDLTSYLYTVKLSLHYFQRQFSQAPAWLTPVHGGQIWINSIAPWFVRTGMNDAIADKIAAKGVIFAQVEDAASAMLKIVSDETIHGRNLAIVPRMWADRGYLDLDQDDHQKGSLPEEMQEIVLRTSHRLETYLNEEK